MKLHLEDWEVGMIISALAELPRDLAGETIQKIEEQAEVDLIHCEECEYFDPDKKKPVAQMFRDLLGNGNQKGICRKTTVLQEHPVMTEAKGFCHRAKPKEK